MWNEPTKERLAKVPRLYDTEYIPVQDKEIHLHFFIGGCDWYISETDGEDIMFGFCILNNDLEMAEWGYVSLSELRSIKASGWCEVDCELEKHWKIRKAKEVDTIKKACGWLTDIELFCHECGGVLTCEPDAKDGFCFDCARIVKIENQLIEAGSI
jgi:hypothetical protein